MNFLELAQDLRREVDLSGAGPNSVAGQTGQLENLVSWTRNAWIDIQNISEGKWRFLRHKFTLETVADTPYYAADQAVDVRTGLPIDQFGRWRLRDRRNTPRMHRLAASSVTKIPLVYVAYDEFQDIYANQVGNTGRPHHITVNPQDEIELAPVPNDAYVVSGEYYRAPQVLMDNTDVPIIKEQFHRVIVYKAMIEYGYQQVSQESLLRADDKYKELLGRLMSDQLESRTNFRVAGPLA